MIADATLTVPRRRALNVTPGQPDDDGRHDYAVLDADDYAVELVACA